MNKFTLAQEPRNTVNLGRHKFFQPLEHLSFLQKVLQDYVSGKLQVFSISQQWSIYFDDGKLIYACQLNEMWNIFYKKIQQLNPEIPNLNNQVCNQLKVIFDSNHDDAGRSSYLAICWLVEQQYLNAGQVTQLIEELALEVMDSFLKLRDGIYEFLPDNFIDDLPKYTHIDISTIALKSQQRARKNGNFTTAAYSASNYLFSDSSQQDLASLNKPQLPQQSYTTQKKVNHYTEAPKVQNKPNNYIDTPVAPIKQINTVSVRVKAPPKDTQIDTQVNTQIDTQVKAPLKDIGSNEINKLYKVMCIDDSPTIIKAMQGFLDEELFQVVGVTDSLKALMQILRAKPDIILLDISMPNLDGYELCSLLRKHPEFRNTPVVMVTGRTGFIDKARAKLVKASGYLTKPFTKAELIKTVFHQVSCLNYDR